MKQYIPILKQTRLFAGLGDEEIAAMMTCLQAARHTCRKGEYVYRQGEVLDTITILVEGKLHIQSDDYWGNRTILHVINEGEMFGEAYAVPNSEPLLNDVVAVEDSVILCFEVRKLLTVCSSVCRFHTMVIQNLFFAISEKNKKLVQKLGHLSKRSTREKLISYLSQEAKRQHSSTFSIPFNRQQLADFLSVDRSAMSKELCKLRDEGFLLFQKNKFTLL